MKTHLSTIKPATTARSFRRSFLPGAAPRRALAATTALLAWGHALAASAEPGAPPAAVQTQVDPGTASSSAPREPAPAASPLPEALGDARDLPARGVLAPLEWSELSGQNVALGYESGSWGAWWQQGLRVGVPFGHHFGVHLRVLYVSDPENEEDAPYRADLGGRLDVIGRSLPLFNVMRLYGGGGVQVFQPVFGTEGRDLALGGGGHFGFEFFCNPHYSFFLEVGGQGPKPSAGATILAGMAFYPWTE